MKLTLKTAILALTLGTAALSATAQDYEPYPYNFISLQGGGQATFTNYPIEYLVRPTYAVGFGRFFSPAVGARLHVNGWENKSGYQFDNKNFGYRYKYVTSDIDLLLNLSNIICPTKGKHWFNAILVGGVGLSYAWDNDDHAILRDEVGINTNPMAWEDDRLVHNFRVGMLFEANVTRHIGINLEVNANNLHDRFNSKQNNHGDWQVTAMAGVTFKFGFKKRSLVSSSSLADLDADNSRNAGVLVDEAPAPVVEPEPAPAPVVPAKTRTEVFFTINSTEVSAAEDAKLATLAAWLKEHPKAKVVLTSYADKGTGTAEINERVSKRRAESVVKALTEKHGVEASRISSSYKGDAEQPFAENDKNRVTIAIAAE